VGFHQPPSNADAASATLVQQSPAVLLYLRLGAVLVPGGFLVLAGMVRHAGVDSVPGTPRRAISAEDLYGIFGIIDRAGHWC
jgi:hypothetical protein